MSRNPYLAYGPGFLILVYINSSDSFDVVPGFGNSEDGIPETTHFEGIFKKLSELLLEGKLEVAKYSNPK